MMNLEGNYVINDVLPSTHGLIISEKQDNIFNSCWHWYIQVKGTMWYAEKSGSLFSVHV